MGKGTRLFCWHQDFVHKGLSAPGLYTCGKTLKMCIKPEFKEIGLKLATNRRSDKGFLLTSKVCPQGVFCPCPGAIYMYKIIKNVYTCKIRFRRGHFETCKKKRPFYCHQNLSPMDCLPLPGAVYIKKNYGETTKSLKNVYKIRLRRDHFETCNTWAKRKGLSVVIKFLSPFGCLLLPGAI